MKNKIAIGILLATLLVVIVASSGCIEEYSGYIEEEEIEEVIPISGMDQDITISSDVPVKLVVSGMRNVITVPNDVKVLEIVMSGMDNTVYIPQSANPQVKISGIRNEVIRYREEETPVKAPETTTSPATNSNVEVITISGMNEVAEVNSDKPIKLIVTGMGSTVTVSSSTIVTEIVIESMNSVVYISENATPKITITGMNSKVIRY